MAFVSGYQHDVFISYAHIDDEPSIPGDNATRWVSTLYQILQTRLDQKLGRKGAVKVWMDRGGLKGNQPVTPDIRAAIASTATLVIIFSRGYLESSWCLEERELFIQAVGGAEAAASRIFLVHLEEIPRAEWPQAFAEDIGYPFYQKDPVEGMMTRLADPKPKVEEQAYWIVLNKLRTEMAHKLKQLPPAPSLNLCLLDRNKMEGRLSSWPKPPRRLWLTAMLWRPFCETRATISVQRWRSPAAGSRSEAGAEQLSWVSRGPGLFFVLDLLALPGRPMLQHGIEHRHQLLPTPTFKESG